MADTTAIDSDTLDIFERSVRGVFAQPGVDVGRRARGDRLARLPRRRPGVGGAAHVRAARRARAREAARSMTSRSRCSARPARNCGRRVMPSRTRVASGARPRARPRRSRSTRSCSVGVATFPVALVVDERVVTIAAAALAWVPVTGIDPELGLARVRGVVAKGDAEVHRDVDGTAVAPACSARPGARAARGHRRHARRPRRSTRRCARSSANRSARSRR